MPPQPCREGMVWWAGIDVPLPTSGQKAGNSHTQLCPLCRRAGLLREGIAEDFEDPGALRADQAEEADRYF